LNAPDILGSAIAGIVIGAIIVVGLVAVIVIYFQKKGKKGKKVTMKHLEERNHTSE
jgi:hypothetical protein